MFLEKYNKEIIYIALHVKILLSDSITDS